jgi:hypothetical protein
MNDISTADFSRPSLFSNLQPLAQGLMKSQEIGKVPKKTPANGPKTAGQLVPPRCAMQGPIRGEPPS